MRGRTATLAGCWWLLLSTPLVAPRSVLAQPLAASEKAIAFVKDRVACSNPEDVAEIAFGDFGDDIFSSDSHSRAGFSTHDLGDGTEGFTFSPPGGNGAFAVRPSFTFERKGAALRLIFDAGGKPFHFVRGGAKLNGRFQIQRRWADWEKRGLWEERLFWNGSAYVPAFRRLLLGETRGGPIHSNVQWEEEHQEFYDAARRSWTHVVVRGENLSQICRQREADLVAVARQNKITDVDQIEAGRILTYDSLSDAPSETLPLDSQ